MDSCWNCANRRTCSYWCSLIGFRFWIHLWCKIFFRTDFITDSVDEVYNIADIIQFLTRITKIGHNWIAHSCLTDNLKYIFLNFLTWNLRASFKDRLYMYRIKYMSTHKITNGYLNITKVHKRNLQEKYIFGITLKCIMRSGYVHIRLQHLHIRFLKCYNPRSRLALLWSPTLE